MVSRYHTYASENYIGILTMQSRYLLFDKTGKFIAQISRRGQGPGEYSGSIYDSFIDEENRRVYLMPWDQRNVLVYSFDGQMLPSIPLSEITPKAKFKINTEQQTIQIGTLPFSGQNNLIAWTQKFDGEVIHSVFSEPYTLRHWDFSNEISSYRNTSVFDFQLVLMFNKPDTLYHYIQGGHRQARLKPVYVIDFGSSKPIFHWHVELPNHFMTIVSGGTQIMVVRGDDVTISGQPDPPTHILVDKSTLQGASINFVIDEMGSLPIPPRTVFRDGFFIANYYPHELKEGLHQVLANPNSPLSRARLDELKILYESIDEDDDNNIIIVGKLRQ
jgi:hypothetical protein